jgi:hypothetical protein
MKDLEDGECSDGLPKEEDNFDEFIKMLKETREDKKAKVKIFSMSETKTSPLLLLKESSSLT